MPSEFCLGPRNLAVAERFSLGTSLVDWPGFFLGSGNRERGLA